MAEKSRMYLSNDNFNARKIEFTDIIYIYIYLNTENYTQHLKKERF